jgi:RNA polymerase sigma-70 factor (ECF subfamily)
VELTASVVTVDALDQDLEEIFREHYRMVYRTAYGVTGNAADAEDIVQTIFLRLLRREVPPDLKKNPKAYLYKAAVNLSLNTIQATKRRILIQDPECLGIPAATSEDSSAEEIHQRLYEAVAQLRPGAAHVLILRYVHNYSDAEIAKLLGTSRGTIAVSLYRSRSRLRKLMRAR